MSTEKLSAPVSRGTVLTTQLDALGTGTQSAAGSELDNTSNRDRFGVAVLAVTFAVAPTLGSMVDLYMSVSMGGNYDDTATVTEEQYVGSFQLDDVTTAQRVRTGRFELSASLLKFVAYNRSGQSFPASGSTVTLYTFNRTVE